MNNLKIAYNSLKRNKSRMILTMIAIALGIAILITMMATGDGLKKMVLSEIDDFGPDMITIETKIPGKKRESSATDFVKGVIITTFKNKDIKEIEKHNNVSAIFGFVTGQEMIRYYGENRSTLLLGYGANAPLVQKINIEEGRFYTKEEEDALSSVIVLGSELKEILFSDEDAISKTVYVRDLPFKVVGVLKKRSTSLSMDFNKIAYIPTLTMQKKLLGTDYVLGAALRIKDVSLLDETKEEVVEILRERHDSKEDDFQVSTLVEELAMINNIVNGINAFLIVLALVSLVVGGVGIMNIMYVSVSERVFEIGLRMALGASKKDILNQFLLEAFLLTLIGGILGVVLGVLICIFFNYLSSTFEIGITAMPSFFSISIAFLFAMVLGFLSGIYPAKRASNLDPIEALRK